MKEFDLITFDCYGTLIDWESGTSEAFLTAAAQEGVDLRREEVLAAYAAAEAQVEQGKFLSYRDVLRGAACLCASRLGWKLTEERATFLPESLPAWKPFPDTNAALERLASSFHLGILSNIDDALLIETLAHFSVSFEIVVTAEQVRSYKPGRPHFDEAARRKGNARWLHAAQSYFHDVQPALDLGIPVAWVNRKGEAAPTGKGWPRYVVRDLGELADRLAG